MKNGGRAASQFGQKLVLRMLLILAVGVMFWLYRPECVSAATVASGRSGGLSWALDSSGVFTLTGTGNFTRGNFSVDTGKRKVYGPDWLRVDVAPRIKSAVIKVRGMTDASCLLCACTELRSVDLSGSDFSATRSMFGMFAGCENLQSINWGNVNTSSLTDTAGMFMICTHTKSLDVSRLNTSRVTDMHYMFGDCKELQTLKLGSFDTSNAADMWGMFRFCQSLSTLDVSGFRTSNATDMAEMFNNCSSLEKLDLMNFDTSRVTDMNWMFNGCESLQNLDLHSFNTSRVRDMSRMFGKCKKLQTVNLSSFQTGTVRDVSDMFLACDSLQTIQTIPDLHMDIILPRTETEKGSWSDSSGNKYTSLPKNQSGSVQLTYAGAKPTDISYRITLDPNGGSVSASSCTVTFNNKYGVLPIPTRKGYIFDGWYTQKNGGSKINADTKVTSQTAHTLYAHWVRLTSLAKASVKVEKCTYNGASQQPAVTVTLQGRTLKKDTDYTVSYANNKNASSKAKVTIKGKGAYTGTVSKKFTISRLPINSSSVSASLSGTSYVYTGKAIKPSIVVKHAGKTLKSGSKKDYTYSYSKNKNIGTAVVTIKGKGNFSGTRKLTFKITGAEQKLSYKKKIDVTYKEIGRKYKIGLSGVRERASVKYTSSDQKVAVVSNKGEITIKGTGTATIEIVCARTTNYKATTVKVSVRVRKQPKLAVQAGKLVYGGQTMLQVSSQSRGKITYKSSTPGIVKVNAAGQMTGVKPGKAVITVSVAADETYTANKKTISVTVEKASRNIIASNITRVIGDGDFAIGASLSAGSGVLTYQSSNANLLTIDANGIAHVNANAEGGSVTVTINAAGNAYYKAAETKVITVTLTRGYNGGAAAEYAVKNAASIYGSGELCAGFVSICMRSTGLKMSYQAKVGNLLNELEKNNFDRYLLSASGSYLYAKGSVNNQKTAVGDPVFFYCSKCASPWAHTGIVTKIDPSTKRVYITHVNPGVNINDPYAPTYYHEKNGVRHSGSDISLYLLHME